MMPLVSILVPVYGVERYILTCARSLFSQSYPNCEFIFVDDCSPDGSVELLHALVERKYSQLRSRVKIVRHATNQGVAVARNTLIDNASGEYITFVDGDDWVDSNMVESAMQVATNEQADIVRMGYMEHLTWGATITRKASHAPSRKALICAVLEQSHIVGNHVAVSILRRSLFEDPPLRFTAGVNMAEDYSLLPILYHRARHIALLEAEPYHYRRENIGSCTNNITPAHTRSYLAANKLVTDYFLALDDARRYRYALALGRINIKKWIRNRGYRTADYAPIVEGWEVRYPLLWLYNKSADHAPRLVVRIVGGALNLPMQLLFLAARL